MNLIGLCYLSVSVCPYRLSDIVGHYGNAHLCACERISSLACLYLQNSKQKRDEPVLARLVTERLENRPWLREPREATVVHIRAADGITGLHCFYNESHCRKNSGHQTYGKGKAYFDAQPIGAGPFVIHVTTTHNVNTASHRSWQRQYLTEVIGYFSERGVVVVKADGDPDDAFVSIASACTVILTGGGFGRLAHRTGRLIDKQC